MLGLASSPPAPVASATLRGKGALPLVARALKADAAFALLGADGPRYVVIDRFLGEAAAAAARCRRVSGLWFISQGARARLGNERRLCRT